MCRRHQTEEKERVALDGVIVLSVKEHTRRKQDYENLQNEVIRHSKAIDKLGERKRSPTIIFSIIFDKDWERLEFWKKP